MPYNCLTIIIRFLRILSIILTVSRQSTFSMHIPYHWSKHTCSRNTIFLLPVFLQFIFTCCICYLGICYLKSFVNVFCYYVNWQIFLYLINLLLVVSSFMHCLTSCQFQLFTTKDTWRCDAYTLFIVPVIYCY